MEERKESERRAKGVRNESAKGRSGRKKKNSQQSERDRQTFESQTKEKKRE